MATKTWRKAMDGRLIAQLRRSTQLISQQCPLINESTHMRNSASIHTTLTLIPDLIAIRTGGTHMLTNITTQSFTRTMNFIFLQDVRLVIDH
jgi:hypothetical protein